MEGLIIFGPLSEGINDLIDEENDPIVIDAAIILICKNFWRIPFLDLIGIIESRISQEICAELDSLEDICDSNIITNPRVCIERIAPKGKVFKIFLGHIFSRIRKSLISKGKGGILLIAILFIKDVLVLTTPAHLAILRS